MKQLRNQLHRLSVAQFAIVLLILGLIIGVLCANIFRTSFAEQMTNYQNNVFPNIVGKDIDYSGLFRYILVNNLKEFLIFWLLCITILGIPYMVFKIIAFGFSIGFMVSVVTMQFGLKGILLVIIYAIPHGFIYLPVAIICLYKGFILCRTIYHENKNHMAGLLNLLKAYSILLLLLAVVLVIGSFLEAYVGSYFLKKTLGLFT